MLSYMGRDQNVATGLQISQLDFKSLYPIYYFSLEHLDLMRQSVVDIHFSVVSVKLTNGQVKKLKSKSAKESGTTITLKPEQMFGGTHKISLTDRQIKHFNDALKNKRRVQIVFSKDAVVNMIKSGGIFPLFTAIPGLIAAAAQHLRKRRRWEPLVP